MLILLMDWTVKLELNTQCSDLAWSWEEFVAICQKLTTDCNGYDATNPNFDAEHITTYAVAFPQSACGC